MRKNRVLIFANTPWEADALVAVFSNAQARPPTAREAEKLDEADIMLPSYFFPSRRHDVPTVDVPGSTKPVEARLAYDDVEVWCVTDLALNQYTSLQKSIGLKTLANSQEPPSLVVAFGTAAFPDPHLYDGCVVVGASVFNFDSQVLPDDERWKDDSIGLAPANLGQPLNQHVFKQLKGRLRLPIESRFLSTPYSGNHPPVLLAADNYVAISDVNVKSANDYAWADQKAIQAFATACPESVPGSVETTHGIIHASVASGQFLFVSAITNRLGYFNMEVAPRNYAQDFAVAHNAGVALAWLLPTLLQHLPE
jgi:hypothetical protein